MANLVKRVGAPLTIEPRVVGDVKPRNGSIFRHLIIISTHVFYWLVNLRSLSALRRRQRYGTRSGVTGPEFSKLQVNSEMFPQLYMMKTFTTIVWVVLIILVVLLGLLLALCPELQTQKIIGGVEPPHKPAPPALVNLRRVWDAGQKLELEIAGIIEPSGDVVELVIGNEGGVHQGFVPANVGTTFHTHPTKAIGGIVLEKDRFSPPSGADVCGLLKGNPAEFIVAERGLWRISPGAQRIEQPQKFFDVVDLYFQILKWDYESDETFTLAKYLLLANRLDPRSLLLKCKIDPSWRDFVDDQLTRYDARPLTVSMLEKQQTELQDKEFFEFVFWPTSFGEEKGHRSNLRGRSG